MSLMAITAVLGLCAALEPPTSSPSEWTYRAPPPRLAANPLQFGLTAADDGAGKGGSVVQGAVSYEAGRLSWAAAATYRISADPLWRDSAGLAGSVTSTLRDGVEVDLTVWRELNAPGVGVGLNWRRTFP